jgi:hypothetical protein
LTKHVAAGDEVKTDRESGLAFVSMLLADVRHRSQLRQMICYGKHFLFSLLVCELPVMTFVIWLSPIATFADASIVEAASRCIHCASPSFSLAGLHAYRYNRLACKGILAEFSKRRSYAAKRII